MMRRGYATLRASGQANGTLCRRLSWSQVVDIVRERAFDRFGRLPEEQALYHRRMKEMREEFASVGDYVLHHKFKYPFDIQANLHQGKKFVIPPPADVENDRYVWVLNDFPYALGDEIDHYLLWSLRPFPEPKIESIIRDHVDSRAIDCVYFTNPPVLRSVPNVSHVHIMTHPLSPPHLEI